MEEFVDVPDCYLTGFVLAPYQKTGALSEIYHENTKLTPISALAYSKSINDFKKQTALVKTTGMPKKTYSLAKKTALEPALSSSDLDLAIQNRRSIRHFSGEAVSLKKVAHILHHTYGITDRQRGYRAVPSGGALYPLELYLASFNVEDLEPGLYHYEGTEHVLDLIEAGSFIERIRKMVFMDDADVEKANLMLFVSAIFPRNTIKYQDRGYRMVLMEVGSVMQNFALQATQLGLGTCSYGGFLDDPVNRLLGLDGVNESVINPMLVGGIK